LTKSLLTSLFHRESYPSLAKRGEGRFSNVYVNSILRPLIIGSKTRLGEYRKQTRVLSMLGKPANKKAHAEGEVRRGVQPTCP